MLEGIYRHYGYDFRQYAFASLKRRVEGLIRSEHLATISGLQERVLHNPECMARFLTALSVSVSSMFRDPDFFLSFRQNVVPMLRTYPFVRIWHAGCATGEEVYSMAILLHEEGLYDRCRIYATDMDDTVLKRAKEGIYPLSVIERTEETYQKAGGKAALNEYYTGAYENALFRPGLRDNVVFSQHNLVLDSSFNEFHVVLCRNVMIYFSKLLQDRVHKLFYDSLSTFGVLGIGSKESIQFTPHEREYEQLETGIKLFRRIR